MSTPLAHPPVHIGTLRTESAEKLIALAEAQRIAEPTALRKRDLLRGILAAYSAAGTTLMASGVLEIHANGFGFLRSLTEDYLPSPDDVYLSLNQIRKFGLRTGDEVEGIVRLPKESEHYLALLQVLRVNGAEPEKLRLRQRFEELTPVFPSQRLVLETGPEDIPMRVLDVITPIGRGQRALIVA
ncbi:MAG TPA: transcription termination factor Rho, partial [Planctomycetota bacterium]|nr:transcription termination factor Rho [Planctomycetota bacterium]